MQVKAAPLEDWLRDYYFAAEIDISSSGVQPYSMAELRAKTGLECADLDALVFGDGYSLGSPDVRTAIARRWGDGDSSKVMTTSGSSEAISLVLTALLRPGDEVVVVQPGYHLLIEFAAALGATVKTWQLRAGDDGWAVSLDELAGLVTARTRAIVVNFPHNPTGASVGPAGMRALVAAAERVGAYLLWDAAFADLIHDGEPLPDVSREYARGIGFGTFSKAFGLPGLRFGWCIGPGDVLAECVRIRDYTTLHLSPLIELLAHRVLGRIPDFLEPRLSQATENRKILMDWVSATDGVSLAPPPGGVAAFPRLDDFANTDDFCEKLFREQRVLVVPGSCFGCPGHIRLGYGGARAELVAGLERLGHALSARPA
jgi:capreomycidine synthase